jgi:hypothetical protein
MGARRVDNLIEHVAQINMASHQATGLALDVREPYSAWA